MPSRKKKETPPIVPEEMPEPEPMEESVDVPKEPVMEDPPIEEPIGILEEPPMEEPVPEEPSMSDKPAVEPDEKPIVAEEPEPNDEDDESEDEEVESVSTCNCVDYDGQDFFCTEHETTFECPKCNCIHTEMHEWTGDIAPYRHYRCSICGFSYNRDMDTGDYVFNK